MQRQAMVLAVVVTLLALTGCTTADLGSAAPSVDALPKQGWHGTALTEPYVKPSVTFTDMNGRPFRIDRDTRRPVVLVAFGYTHCPWVCSRVLTDVAAALKPMDPGTRGKIQLLFVTVDPARDDGAALRHYLARFDPTFLGLSAPLAVVRRVGQDLGVPVTGKQSDDADYTVGHGAQVVGFGPDGEAHLMWMPGTAPADLRADLVRLASSS
jgi:protein SCO1/2